MYVHFPFFLCNTPISSRVLKVLMLNITVLPMLFLKLVGFVTCSLSFIVLFLRQLLFIVITLVMFICRATLSIINALSILRWTFILFMEKFNVVMFGCFMFHLEIRLPIFLPRVFLKFYLMIFDSVSASANLSIRLRGFNRIKYFVYFLNLIILLIIL